MKKNALILIVLVAAKMATAQPAPAITPVQQDITKVLVFTNADYDFGKIPFNKSVEYVVQVKNISKDTVTLVNVQAGCGCTTPNFTPNEKLAPGQTGKVTIHFNGGTMGPFSKASTAFFSGNITKQLMFKGEGVQETVPAAPAPAQQVEKSQIQKN